MESLLTEYQNNDGLKENLEGNTAFSSSELAEIT